MMNQLIIRMPRRWWHPPGTARVTVSGFATAHLHGMNACMEWLLPAGNYTVYIDTGEQHQQLQYSFNGGQRVVVEVSPPVSRRWKNLFWLCLLLAGSGLLLAALWWELTHKYYLLAGGTLLVTVAAALRFYKPWHMLRWRVQQGMLYNK